jgi:hypothetical protein
VMDPLQRCVIILNVNCKKEWLIIPSGLEHLACV